ncbi:DUF2490 domain-containing protein [Psychroflexus planctonicus]|uniref:DUF2490 domain-containing protein n=1 Tax=Psychroflexus planctonicus TaxID=1526575 RepID=A0ABQ1SKR2_9FLAO|nr:DUF2490 domain-containing protein [Psychroflexus planctonicus]GGE41711.1 hypothetical protein GCM10010832_22170 [Psychroflexus planctonicus]
MLEKINVFTFCCLLGLLCLVSNSLTAQGIGEMETALMGDQKSDASVVREAQTQTWFNSYGTFRLTDKWYWHGELHYRRNESNKTLFFGEMAQVYNRHGIKYIPTKNFSATAGGVLRLDFNPNAEEGFNSMILEPRIWHEYIWTMPYERFRIYHRIRIEHRWKKGFEKGDEYVFGNRWRYKFLMKIPLNKPKLQPGAFYFSPDVELIMQTGSKITDNPLEDLRIFPTFAYIANPRVTYSAGLMYTTGQTSQAGYIYRERFIVKFNVYINLDFRKFDDKIPETSFYD